MALTINVIIGLDPALMRLASDLTMMLRGKLNRIIISQEHIMATLDDIVADVTAETTAIASVATLIQGLRDQIANAGLTPADQAKVDAIFAAAEANKAALATALDANVPPAA